MTKIFTVDVGNDKIEYFMTIDGAKKRLSDHGYIEVSAEDFNNNTRGQWRHPATFFFAESYAYLGFVKAND